MPSANADVGIIDIREEKNGPSIDTLIRDGLTDALQVSNGNEDRFMPELLLWDEAGHILFEEVINRKEYYVQTSEIEMLERHAHEIAKQLEPGAMIVELGSGNLSKTKILLQAVEDIGTPITFYALDISRSNLHRSFQAIPADLYKHVQCHALWGAFTDGLSWLKQPANASRQKCLLSLGATVGNFARDEAPSFLRDFSTTFTPGGKDFMLISLDACKERERIVNAYNDREGINQRFNAHGLQHANEVLGAEIFKADEWRVEGEWNAEAGRHEWFYTPTAEFRRNDYSVRVGDKLAIIHSYMYDEEELRLLLEQAGLTEHRRLSAETAPYNIHVLVRPKAEELENGGISGAIPNGHSGP